MASRYAVLDCPEWPRWRAVYRDGRLYMEGSYDAPATAVSRAVSSSELRDGREADAGVLRFGRVTRPPVRGFDGVLRLSVTKRLEDMSGIEWEDGA